jgi:hypothetical protein
MSAKSAATKARMEVQDVVSTEDSTPVSPPELFVPKAKVNGAEPKPVEKPKSPSQSDVLKLSYPARTRLFWYEPEGNGDPIPLPLDLNNPPDKLFFWELHQVKNPWVQIASYMDRFDVPKPVQRYVFDKLPDAELMVMCNKWFEQMGGGATAGE